MKTGRKITGGKYHASRKKKLYERAGQQRHVKLHVLKRKTLRVKGGNEKNILLTSDIANVLNEKTKKMLKAKIVNVLETPSNRFLARQNIMTKGTIIETEIGKARITSRPSQSHTINAILLEEKN